MPGSTDRTDLPRLSFRSDLVYCSLKGPRKEEGTRRRPLIGSGTARAALWPSETLASSLPRLNTALFITGPENHRLMVIHNQADSRERNSRGSGIRNSQREGKGRQAFSSTPALLLSWADTKLKAESMCRSAVPVDTLPSWIPLSCHQRNRWILEQKWKICGQQMFCWAFRSKLQNELGVMDSPW